MSREPTDDLTAIEAHFLLAILRLQPAAYGISIRDEIAKRIGKGYSIGTIYTSLQRMEAKGFVSTKLGEPTEERGGRAKAFFFITGKGARAVDRFVNAVDRLRDSGASAGVAA